MTWTAKITDKTYSLNGITVAVEYSDGKNTIVGKEQGNNSAQIQTMIEDNIKKLNTYENEVEKMDSKIDVVISEKIEA
jgi:hypothetical protein